MSDHRGSGTQTIKKEGQPRLGREGESSEALLLFTHPEEDRSLATWYHLLLLLSYLEVRFPL